MTVNIKSRIPYLHVKISYQTSSCVQWTLYLLAKNQLVQQALLQEVQQNFDTTAGDFSTMPYLRACIKESLRYISVNKIAFQ